jgi:hypothetical protein
VPGSLATVLAGFLIVFSTGVFAAEVERINPPGIYKYTGVHAGYYRAGWQEDLCRRTDAVRHGLQVRCTRRLQSSIHSVMEGLKTALQAAGATLDDVVQRRAFVFDIDKYLAVT